MQFLPYQQQWIDNQAPLKVWVHCRRAGATVAEAYSTVDASIKGLQTLWICSNTEPAMRTCFHLAKANPIPGISFSTKQDMFMPTINFTSGGRIAFTDELLSFTRGKAWDRIVLEEAAFFPGFSDWLQQVFLPMERGTQISINSCWGEEKEEPQDGTEENPFNRYVRFAKILNPQSSSVSLQITDFDQALADGLYRKICEVNGEEWSSEKQHNWAHDLASQFDDYWREAIMKKHGPEFLMKELKKYGGYGPCAWQELYCGGIGMSRH